MRYKALALQTSCFAVNHISRQSDAHNKILSNMDIVDRQIRASKAFIGTDLALVVLPEYFATGFPLGESMAEWQEKACITIGDDLYKRMSQMAVDSKIYLSGNFYEIDPNFPKFYFQCSFVIDPKGELILRYRRLNSMFAVTPYDVLTDYVKLYGDESLFPVVKTEIGNLACIASEEILYPEITRCLMMRGAEIICHHTSEVSSPLPTQKNIAKSARAIENMAYVVSANSAGIIGTAIPAQSTDGSSKIINYEGITLAEAGQGESMVASATIDIEALRAHRQRPGMANFISRQRNELFARSYQKYSFYPSNTWHEDFQKSDFIAQQKQVIKNVFNS
jgi:deaminated glutathione amidase